MFRGVGVLCNNVSQILAIINFSSGEIARETSSVRKNFIDDINLGLTNCLNLDKFGIRNFAADWHRSHKL